MTINADKVKAIAHLARIGIDENDIHLYQQDLNNIMDFISQFQSANTSNIEPLAHPLDGEIQRLREDEISESDCHKEFQAIAPNPNSVEADLYLVPKVID